jgi:hypothetical protein
MSASWTLRSVICLCLIPIFIHAPLAAQESRIELQLDASEADSVLSILDKQAANAALTDVDWKRLFDTEPYARLKKREESFHRGFTDDDFKKFVLSTKSRRGRLRCAILSTNGSKLTCRLRPGAS